MFCCLFLASRARFRLYPPLRLRGVEADNLPGVAQGDGEPVHGDLDRLGYEEGLATGVSRLGSAVPDRDNRADQPSLAFHPQTPPLP